MVALINVNLVFDRDPIQAPHLSKQFAHRTYRLPSQQFVDQNRIALFIKYILLTLMSRRGGHVFYSVWQ